MMHLKVIKDVISAFHVVENNLTGVKIVPNISINNFNLTTDPIFLTPIITPLARLIPQTTD